MTNRNSLAINARGVTRSYGNTKALQEVDIQVPAGKIVAILGPNGAGKTTLVEILEGLRHRDRGTVDVLGTDPADAPPSWRGRIGAVLQTESQSDELTVGETLHAFAAYYPTPAPVSRVIERLDLTTLLDRRLTQLSGGQRRRLDIALGVVGNPELLFLDEPTTGLDPEVRRDIWDLIRSLRADGTTIVMTTHYLDEVEQLADSVVLLLDGSVAMTGTAAELRAEDSVTSITFELAPGLDPARLPADLPGNTVEIRGRLIRYEAAEPTAFVTALMEWAGSSVTIVEITKPSLEDAYVTLLNNGTEEK